MIRCAGAYGAGGRISPTGSRSVVRRPTRSSTSAETDHAAGWPWRPRHGKHPVCAPKDSPTAVPRMLADSIPSERPGGAVQGSRPIARSATTAENAYRVVSIEARALSTTAPQRRQRRLRARLAR